MLKGAMEVKNDHCADVRTTHGSTSSTDPIHVYFIVSVQYTYSVSHQLTSKKAT